MNADGSVTVTGTPSATTTYVFCALSDILETGKDYMGYGLDSGQTSDIYFGLLGVSGVPNKRFYDSATPFSTADISTKYTNVIIRVDGSSAVNITLHPMICEKTLYDIDSSYVPYALPNSDLTVLEAEDRASLAEVVDSGAKNLWANGTSGTISGWRETFQIGQTLKKGTYIISFDSLTSTDTDANTCQIIALNGTTQVSNYAQCPRGNKVYTILEISADANALWIYSSNSSGTGDGDTATFTNGMICTKAAFGVSNKFVPYAKSNYSLTQYTDGCTLDTVSKSSGSLDDIATNAFAVYSASVTGKPVDDDGNTSAFTGLCRTDVYNSSEAMQTLRRLSNSHAWVRTKSASTWNPWIKQGVAPYIVSSNTASVTNLLYDATSACGLSPTAKIHSGMISVTTNTNGESLLVFFTYKHGVYASAQSITNSEISFAGVINNLGTFGVSGGTAPYNFSVMFFN